MNKTEVVQEQTTAITLFDLQESVFKEIESYKKFEITDTESEKEVRKARMDVRQLRYKIQNRHKDLNADLNQKKKDYKDAAESLIARLEPTENNLDGKIKAVEEERETRRLEKERIEQERQDAINEAMGRLVRHCSRGLQYGLESERITAALENLLDWKVEEDCFQEATEKAKEILLNGISNTRLALDARLKFEKEQAELKAAKEAQAKAEADAKAKREAEEKAMAAERAEQARIQAEAQAKLNAERKAFEVEQAKAKAEAKRIADLEAEKQRKEAEKIRLEREAMEAEKARVAAEEKARRDAELLRKEIDDAHAEALEMNIEFDGILEIKAKAEAKRLEALRPDKEKLRDFAEAISNLPDPDLKTDEAKNELAIANHHLRQAIGSIIAFVDDGQIDTTICPQCGGTEPVNHCEDCGYNWPAT